jgi:hypothetical protein
MRARRSLVIVVAAMAAAAGCGESAPAEPVEIAEIVDDVEYYIGCANEPVTVAGVTWYPLPDFQFADEVADIAAISRATPGGARGFALRVAPPGPGDDIGTLVVFADGVARYESDSGQAIWLTREEQTYNWVC